MIVSLEIAEDSDNKSFRIVLSDVEWFRSIDSSLVYCVFVNNSNTKTLVKSVHAFNSTALQLPINVENIKQLSIMLDTLQQMYPIDL